MNFARGIMKHRDGLRYADPGGRWGTLTPRLEGASAEEAVPFPVDIHRRFALCRYYRRDTLLRALPLNKLRKSPPPQTVFANRECKGYPASTMTFM